MPGSDPAGPLARRVETIGVRRLLLLVVALVLGAGSLVPAQGAVYAGESLIAAAAVLIRGTDGHQYMVEVQVARHELDGVQVDHVLRVRLAVCNENGCFGPWYPLEANPADIVFTPEGASVRGVFAGSPFSVQWKARRAKKDLDPTTASPDADTRDGTTTVTAHKDIRSAPAVVHLPGLACKTASSTMVNQVGVVVTQDESSDAEPRKLPAGFFPGKRSKPRCF